MLRDNLRFKLSLYLLLALSPAAFLLPYLIVENQRQDLQAEVARRATEIAQLVVKSTRHAMMMNEREMADQIAEDIGRQEQITWLRMIRADGTIIYSKKHSEVLHSIEQQDEPCVQCHRGSEPLTHVADADRWRVYTDADGRRLLAAMEPIRNEPSCSNAACHEHPAGTQVLGIVDIAYSLEGTDRTLRDHALFIFLLSTGIIMLVAVGGGTLLQRMIYVPLRDLNVGAMRIANGDLDHKIPVRSGDEFGRLAQSFNLMGGELKRTLHELKDLVQTLEHKVEERTKELRSAEAEIAQGEKLASIGMLASGIAHELNNPLTGVLTFTTLVRQKMPEGSTEAEDLDLVIRETKRCAGIIRRLLDFAREKVPTEGYMDLNAVIEDVVQFVFNPATRQRIEVDMRLAQDLPKVWGDADLVKQVVLNILVNATQAIEGPGRVVIETRRVGPAATPGALPMVEFAIRDNGCGMSPAHMKRLFEPFFTTKEVGKGTGLGLSVSYGIVKAHGGTIKAESAVGEGSTFRVQLPTASPFAPPAPPPTHTPS